jgi:hypothetical protein
VVMEVCGGGEGGGGDVAVGGDAEADGLGAACGGQVGLGEFAVRGGEADAESFGFAGRGGGRFRSARSSFSAR